MKVTYTCDVCGEIFSSAEAAQRCERRPTLADAERPPPGVIYAHDRDPRDNDRADGQCDWFFVGVVSDHRPRDPWGNDHLSSKRHDGNAPIWWFRGNGLGDEIDHQWRIDAVSPRIGTGTNHWREGDSVHPNALKSETMKRAVAYVRSRGLVPRMYKDGVLVEVKL